jgi:hypothetical protein
MRPQLVSRVGVVFAVASLGLAAIVGFPGAVADEGAHVGGPLVSDATWTAAGGPYVVDRPVQIAEGVTLTIEAGAEVLASAASKPAGRSGTVFEVAGTLNVGLITIAAAASIDLDIDVDGLTKLAEMRNDAIHRGLAPSHIDAYLGGKAATVLLGRHGEWKRVQD